jgi:predicted amidohydrolase YtcJ
LSATLYTGGPIVTLEPGAAAPAALATADGHIVAVGDTRHCRDALAAAGARDFAHVDLAGRCLLPGFIDTHLHPIMQVYFDANADLRGVRSIPELQDELRRRAATLPPGEWLVGLQLQDEDLVEKRLPTRVELDAACADRPLVLVEHDGHSAVGNRLALAAAGIDALAGDPPGGRIARDALGAADGACFEAAAQQLLGAVPAPSVERLRHTAAGTFARMTAHGITSAGVILQTDEEGPAGAAGALEAVAMGLLLETLPFSIYAILIGRDPQAAVAARATPLHDPAAGRRVGGFKIFADGTFGSCTACMHEPFSDRAGERGLWTHDADELFARMRAAHAAGLQLCIHAIGDAAVARCVELYERLLAETPKPDHRHRIEHASLVPPELIGRIAALGIAVSTQPLFIHSEKTWLHRRLGAERARHVYPLRALLDAGVLVGGASDAPVESLDVLHAIQCCVTREGFEPQQGLTPLESLRLFTRDAARLQFEESEKGTLAAGKRADLVVTSGNPLACPPDRIADLRVVRTVTGGRVVYDADGSAA